MGTRGQLATPSDSTVEGRPGLVLDNVLDCVPEGALGSQLGHVDKLDDHVVYLVLDVLEGGEGDVNSNLLLLVVLLSPCFLSKHLHVDLLRLGVVVLGGDDVGLYSRRLQLLLLHINLLRLYCYKHRCSWGR